jgi:hypothetical protein
MKTWRAQLAGAVLIAVMAIALGVEASHLHRGVPPPATTAATPFPISHHTCARAEGDNTGLTQASDGTFSACLRVGAVAAGHDQVAARRLAGKGVPDSGAANRPGDWITLAPASGRPGSLVTVTGYVAGATPGQPRADHAPLCWAACDALTGYVDISWSPSQAGLFTAQFLAPAAPWFAGGKIAPLQAGRYAVVFPCLPGFEKPSGLCSGSRLVAHFDLTGAGSGLCTTGASCASLQTSPAEGPPGTLVAVDGWAPLTGLNGTGFIDVAIEGQPQGKPGSASAAPLIASTPFMVTGAPGWESLASMHPLSVQRTGLAPFGVDPGNANRFAYCADGVVDITSNAGRSWSAVSLAGVHTASAATNYPIPWSFSGSPRPTCDAVFLDPKNAGTMYAVFSTVPRNSGPPPFNLIAYVSRNSGRTWQPVPVPGGSEMGRFDGFRVDGSAAQALFWKSDAATYVPDPNAFIVQETADGGRTWHVGALHCPAAGACLALGPQDNGRCQAVGDWESILTSANSGRSWSIPGWPNRLGACSASELVGLAGGGVAALDGSSQYPLVVSTNGGATWAALALPPLPGAAGDLGGCCGWVLQMLPDGRLLVMGSAWYLLAPGATQWCSPTTMPAGQPSAYPGMAPMVMGDRLWWLDSTRNGPGAFTSSAKSVPISSLHC